MTKSSRGIWLLVLAMLLVPILPWIVLGPRMELWAAGMVSGEGASGLSRTLLGALGVGLLASDSFLPIPSTLVMSALGFALGTLIGGLAASAGVFLSGAIAFWVCRRWGAGMARRIAGEKGLARVDAAMQQQGVWLIAATRSVPVVQEATACLAGVTQMPAKLFFSALAAGCIPTGFAYAAIGASALHDRWWAAGLSIVLPLVTWPFVYLVVRSSSREGR